MRQRTLLVFLVWALWPVLAPAEFVPGRIYVTSSSGPCDKDLWPNQRIWEFDPATGSSRIFVELPEGQCGFMTGLTFTPDGSRLRASMYSPSAILEFDSDGNFTTALGPADGVFGPLGGNNIAYDRDGDFYVGGSRRILRFPAGGGPGELFGDGSDGIIGDGPIALAPNNDLYYGPANAQVRTIWRFTGPGQSALFDTLPENASLASLGVDSSGNVFASTDSGVYRYDGGDPARRELISTLSSFPSHSSMALAADGSELFIATPNRIYSVDAQSGATTLLLTIPAHKYELVGYGIAVAIPETSTFACLLALVAMRGVWRLSRTAPKGELR